MYKDNYLIHILPGLLVYQVGFLFNVYNREEEHKM